MALFFFPEGHHVEGWFTKLFTTDLSQIFLLEVHVLEYINLESHSDWSFIPKTSNNRGL